jgi:hypothetical protein
MSIEILLNQAKLDQGLKAAMARFSNANKAGYKHKYDSTHLTPERILQLNWQAACAEIVVAQWLKVPNFVLSVDTYKSEPDIPPDWEVKHTEYAGGHLIIEENDRDSDRAVLVTGSNPFVIQGWLPVKFCKDDLYLKTTSRNTAYWVPQSELVKVYEPVPQT